MPTLVGILLSRHVHVGSSMYELARSVGIVFGQFNAMFKLIGTFHNSHER